MNARIFIAEDEPASRELLAAQLEEQGFAVRAFANGAELLGAVRSEPPDLVISDALMPVLDGFRLCLQMRRDPGLCHIPFIIYTATYTGRDDAELAGRVGSDVFLIKPDEFERLDGVIGEVLARYRSAPARPPVSATLEPRLIEDYTQRSFLKLESKLLELHAANAEIRSLNARLELSVTSLRREVEERRQAEDLLNLALRVAAMGAWSRDFTTGRLWVSPSLKAILGLVEGAGEIVIEDLVRIAHPDDRRFVEQVFVQQQGTEHDFDFEVRVVRGGREGCLHVRSEVFRTPDGTPLRRIGIVQDISDLKRAQIESQALDQRLRQAQKMEAIGAFAAGIAHDFNNILAIIYAHADLMACDPAYAAESSRSILNAAGRGRDMVEQMLGFASQQKAPRQPVDLREPVAEAIRLLEGSLTAGTAFDHRLPAGPVMVTGNATQLLRLVLNLGKNALQSMAGRNPARLTVGLEPAQVDSRFALLHPPLRPGPAVVLRVTDTGHGMDPAVLARIFEPFFTTKGAGGTGLGLALVHGIVTQHEGVILVDSVAGSGTTFSVWLPLLPGAESGPATRSPERSPGKGKHILVVDDEPSITAVTVRLLTQLGYVAEAAHDPAAAHDLILANPAGFDLVITDYQMPGISGVELARKVWQSRPDLPFILVAGYGPGIDSESVREDGFEQFLAKPFTLHQLKAACAHVFRPR